MADRIPGVFRRHIGQTIDDVIAKTLPVAVEEIVIETFERHPNAKLTNVGFGWALSVALRKHWADVEGGEAARWLWEYIGSPFGERGYEWTYAAAQKIAAQYISEFGESAT